MFRMSSTYARSRFKDLNSSTCRELSLFRCFLLFVSPSEHCALPSDAYRSEVWILNRACLRLEQMNFHSYQTREETAACAVLRLAWLLEGEDAPRGYTAATIAPWTSLDKKNISSMYQRHMPKWRIKESVWAFGRASWLIVFTEALYANKAGDGRKICMIRIIGFSHPRRM